MLGYYVGNIRLKIWNLYLTLIANHYISLNLCDSKMRLLYSYPLRSAKHLDGVCEISVIDGWGIFCEIALSWMPLDLAYEKSTFVQLMAWCCQAISHYLRQYRSRLSYAITRLQWVTSIRWWTKHDRNFACQIASLYNIPYNTTLSGCIIQASLHLKSTKYETTSPQCQWLSV